MTPDTLYSTLWTSYAANDSVPRTASLQTNAATEAIQDCVSGSDDPQVLGAACEYMFAGAGRQKISPAFAGLRD
jgi:hypothetical protein